MDIGDSEIDYVRTSLENMYLKRRIQNLNDFLENISIKEAGSILSDIRFHKLASDAKEMLQSSTEIVTSAYLQRDSSRNLISKVVEDVLRFLVTRPFKILQLQTIQELQEADVLFDLLVVAKENAIWGLRY